MRINFSLYFGSVKVDKVFETDNGEILHRVFPAGDLRHEAWFDDLEEELQSQIMNQLEELGLLELMPEHVAA